MNNTDLIDNDCSDFVRSFRTDSSISNSCPDPNVRANNGVLYSYTGRAVGSIATASCKSKTREIAGGDTHVCLECGRWSGVQPQCVRNQD